MDLKRRQLIGTGLALPIAAAARLAHAQVPPCAPGLMIDGVSTGGTDCAVSSGGPLLSASDFAYLGYYNVETDGNDSTYYQGVAVRNVGGEPRLLIAHLRGTLVEVPVKGSYGSMLGPVTGSWNISAYLNWQFKNVWWDGDGNRLWTLNTDDYTVSTAPCRLYTMTLGSGGAVSGVRGPIGLSDVSSKRTRSGILKVPASFQSSAGVGPYAIGLGGYTSLMEQGGACAMGASLYAIPDPANAPGDGLFKPGQYKVMAARGATPRGRRIWYGYNFSSQTGKGPINYFDGGDSRPNPSTRPTSQPSSSGGWLSPASDGHARWLWGDRYVGGAWIEGQNKRGVVLVGDFGTGYGWYQSSALAWDGRTCEAHVFDPAHLADVVAGRRSASSVEPVAMAALPQTDSGPDGAYGRNCNAAYDPVGKRLYILKCAMSGAYTARVYVYSVNS